MSEACIEGSNIVVSSSNHLDSLVFVFMNDIERTVIGTIIHDDEFIIMECLAQCTFYGFSYVCFCVVSAE